MFEQLEIWHVLVLAAAAIFVGWCILRNRPIKTEAELLQEEIGKKKARIIEQFVDQDLNESVVMAKKK